jgi:hypothetical protein
MLLRSVVCAPQGTLQMLRFAAALSVVPPPGWLAAADAALQGYLRTYPPAELLQGLRALPRLRLVPSSALLAATEAAVAGASAAPAVSTKAMPQHQQQQQQQQQAAVGGPPGSLSTPPLQQQLQEALGHLQQAAAAGTYPRQPRQLALAHRQRLKPLQLRQPTPRQLVPHIVKQQQRWRRLGHIKRLGGRGSSRRHGVGWQRAAETAVAVTHAEAGGSSAAAVGQGPAAVLHSSASNGANAASAVVLQEVTVVGSQA